MENKEYGLGTIVIMKKQHPCGTNRCKNKMFKLWKNSTNSKNRI